MPVGTAWVAENIGQRANQEEGNVRMGRLTICYWQPSVLLFDFELVAQPRVWVLRIHVCIGVFWRRVLVYHICIFRDRRGRHRFLWMDADGFVRGANSLVDELAVCTWSLYSKQPCDLAKGAAVQRGVDPQGKKRLSKDSSYYPE